MSDHEQAIIFLTEKHTHSGAGKVYVADHVTIEESGWITATGHIRRQNVTLTGNHHSWHAVDFHSIYWPPHAVQRVENRNPPEETS